MNDLSQYKCVKATIKEGDVVFFWGVAAISHAIELFAPGPTHVAMVQSVNDIDAIITQSTIEGHKNGVQSEYLGWTLQTYGEGARAVLAPLSEDARARMDWAAFRAFIAQETGRVRYDVGGLFLYALHKLTFGATPLREDPHEMFCSAYATALLQAGKVLPASMDYSAESPQEFGEFKIFKPFVPLLGTVDFRSYNSRAV